jgi:hypothetical protein
MWLTALCGQTKTRPTEGEPGFKKSALCDSAEETNPASTVLNVRAEVRLALRVVALSLLTRFRRKRLLGET